MGLLVMLSFLVPALLPDALLPDTSARWRLRCAHNRRYLFMESATSSLVSSHDFFSLFGFVSSSDGSYFISEHSSRGLVQLSSEAYGSRKLLVTAHKRRKRWLHSEHPLPPAPPPPSPPAAPRWWIKPAPEGGISIRLREDDTHVLVSETSSRDIVAMEGKQQPAPSPGNSTGLDGCAFVLEQVVPAAAPADAPPGPRKKAFLAMNRFKRRLKKSAIHSAGRDIVLATSHNLGTIDWAPLFWSWLLVHKLSHLWLVHTDGQTCDAAKALNGSVALECISPEDLILPAHVMSTDGVLELDWKHDAPPDWGLRQPGDSRLLRRSKVSFLAHVLAHQFDAIYLDVNVLVLSPEFLPSLAKGTADLAIASDARTGRFGDHVACPASPAMYQSYASDWIDAGLFYLRSTQAAALFLEEVQSLMDEYAIDDTDAMQALLTGHAQVSDPIYMRRRWTLQNMTVQQAFQSNKWLKPLWLEQEADAHAHQSRGLSGQQGIRPINAPLKWETWSQLEAKLRSSTFRWEQLRADRYGNGPTMMEHWNEIFGRALGALRTGTGRNGAFLAIHANCHAKSWLEQGSGSYLLRPETEATTLAHVPEREVDDAATATAFVLAPRSEDRHPRKRKHTAG